MQRDVLQRSKESSQSTGHWLGKVRGRGPDAGLRCTRLGSSAAATHSRRPDAGKQTQVSDTLPDARFRYGIAPNPDLRKRAFSQTAAAIHHLDRQVMSCYVK